MSATSAAGQVIYQLFPRVFDAGGTLDAALPRLDALADLGIDIVELTPINLADDDMDRAHWSARQKQSGYDNPKNPYRIADYTVIDDEYGDDASLQRFVDRCHELGMRVILDIVYFHCGPRAGFLDQHPDFVQRDADGSMCCGDWAFPRLDFDNPALREHLWSNMEYFIRAFDVDGYRCDVAGMVPLDFWEEGRRRIEALKPGCFMLSETEGTPEELHSAFDCSYGFSFVHRLHEFLKGERSLADVCRCLEEQLEGGIADRVLRGFDNHDIANDDYEQRTETMCTSAAAEAALALCLTLPGMPFIYNGQEVCDAGRHSLWSNRFHGPQRCIDWARGERDEGRRRHRVLQQLIALRQAHPALSRGGFRRIDTATDEVLAFLRTADDERMLVVLNMGAEAREPDLDVAGAWQPVFNMRCAGPRQQDGQLHLALEAQGCCVLLGR